LGEQTTDGETHHPVLAKQPCFEDAEADAETTATTITAATDCRHPSRSVWFATLFCPGDGDVDRVERNSMVVGQAMTTTTTTTTTRRRKDDKCVSVDGKGGGEHRATILELV
jgi:hypothetical protein